METPSSTRRTTRSQTLAASNNGKNGVSAMRKPEESENVSTESRQSKNGKQQQDRSALFDITNDSPIVGLAMGCLETPSSALSKKRFSSRTKQDFTPGSGEALLRGQVKTLLQKVEEEAELSKLSLDKRPLLQIQGFIHSPSALIAPTPANTPQILNFSANGNHQSNGFYPLSQSCPVEDKFAISQMVGEIFEEKRQEGFSESVKNLMITRSLLLDFSEKSEGSSCLSEVTSQGGDTTEGKERASATTDDDDDASIWSIQVNASTKDDQEDDEQVTDEVEVGECENDNFYEEEEDDDAGFVDELCEGIRRINVDEGGRIMPKFAGKHIRFVYNSDDELEGGEEETSKKSSIRNHQPFKLKGLPTPNGKHLRFPDY